MGDKVVEGHVHFTGEMMDRSDISKKHQLYVTKNDGKTVQKDWKEQYRSDDEHMKMFEKAHEICKIYNQKAKDMQDLFEKEPLQYFYKLVESAKCGKNRDKAIPREYMRTLKSECENWFGKDNCKPLFRRHGARESGEKMFNGYMTKSLK